MSKAFAAFIILLSLVASPSTAASEPDTRHLLEDICAKPSDAIFPAVHVYRLRNGGTIVFIAVAHIIDTKSKEDKEKILKSISDSFDDYRPSIVFVEGASFHKSEDHRYTAFLDDTARRQFESGNIS